MSETLQESVLTKNTSTKRDQNMYSALEQQRKERIEMTEADVQRRGQVVNPERINTHQLLEKIAIADFENPSTGNEIEREAATNQQMEANETQEVPEEPSETLATEKKQAKELALELVAIRARNQEEIEQQLPTTFGLSFSDRLAIIRPKIFQGVTTKFGKKYDEHINDIRTRNLSDEQFLPGEKGLQTADNTAMREIFLPQFEKQIDTLYEEIKILPDEQKAEAAVRLASYLFTSGIMLHMYDDGNGQTFKMLTLSYLHELGGLEYKNKYMPKKTGQETSYKQDPLPTRNLVDIPQLYDVGLSPTEYPLLNKYIDLRRTLAISRKYKSAAMEKEVAKIEREIDTLFPNNRDRMEEASKLYEAKQKQFNFTGFNPVLQRMATAYLDFIINTQDGRDFVSDYILKGTQPEEQERNIFNPYRRRTVEILSGLQRDFENLPERQAA